MLQCITFDIHKIGMFLRRKSVMSKLRPAIIFDRDGVINELVDRGEGFVVAGENIRYTAPWTVSELKIFPKVASVIQELKQRGYLTVIATNQPDVAHGLISSVAFEAMMEQIMSLGFDAAYVCKHTPAHGCDCRKPAPGMLLRAAQEWSIDRTRSFMVGDMETDILAGYSAGYYPILINRPYNGHIVPSKENPFTRIHDLRELSEMSS